jgi:UDP-3-O-[3-hydroxymyristoyl] glucosamine N-acyltransferase
MKLEPTFTLKEIAGLINAEFEGDPNSIVSGINEIHKVEPGDLTFVDHPKYYDKALGSKATTIIINERFPVPPGKGLIHSDDPFRDYVSLVKKFRTFEPCHEMISKNAKIGSGTVIQPGAFIGNNVVIGKDCIIHSNVSIYDHSVIGDRVIIHSNSVIGGDAFYFKRRPDHFDKMESCGTTIIEDDVEIGCMCAIDKGVSGATIIGKGTKFDNHVQIGHDSVLGRNCMIGANTAIAGVVTVEDDVIIWAKCAINKDITIGKGAVILACSGTDKSIKGGQVYWGIPAEPARKKWKEIAYIKRLHELFENNGEK